MTLFTFIITIYVLFNCALVTVLFIKIKPEFKKYSLINKILIVSTTLIGLIIMGVAYYNILLLK